MAGHLCFVLVGCPLGNVFKFGLITTIKIRNFHMKFRIIHTVWACISLWKQLAKQSELDGWKRTVTLYFRRDLSSCNYYSPCHSLLCPSAKAWCPWFLLAFFQPYFVHVYYLCPCDEHKGRGFKAFCFSSHQVHSSAEYLDGSGESTGSGLLQWPCRSRELWAKSTEIRPDGESSMNQQWTTPVEVGVGSVTEWLIR